MTTIQVFFIVLSICMNLLFTCDVRYANTPVYGLRCISSVKVDRWQAARPQCVWRCLRKKSCFYVNHNSATGQCELGLGQCESLQAAAGFVVNVFGPPRHGCLRWSSGQELGWEPIQERGGGMYVGRIVSNGVALLGHYITADEAFWSVREGSTVGPVLAQDQVIQFLAINETCTVLWMPFTVAEPLPFGAAIGDRLTDRSVTYVAKVIQNGWVVFGYFDPESDLEYHEFWGPKTATSMDLLVLL